jgi:hypothetical protein
MTRFAGSEVSFAPPSLASAGGSSNYSAAAGVVDVNDALAAQRSKAPKYGDISAYAMQTEADKFDSAVSAAGDVTGYGLQALGTAKSGQMQAKASIKATEEKAGADKAGALMGGIGQIASAAIPLLSDETTKSDVKRIDTALETLRSLRPVTFHYKEEYSSSPERMHHGFLAQEFQKVLPDATYFDESIGKLAIDTGDVIGLLVRANQELEARIGMLEAKQALATV